MLISLRRACFSDDTNIFFQTPNSDHGVWVSSESCVWDGPDWVSVRKLATIPSYKNLEPFFKGVLGISDAKEEQFIEELRHQKHSVSPDTTIINQIYEQLWSAFRNDSSIGDALRYVYMVPTVAPVGGIMLLIVAVGKTSRQSHWFLTSARKPGGHHKSASGQMMPTSFLR